MVLLFEAVEGNSSSFFMQPKRNCANRINSSDNLSRSNEICDLKDYARILNCEYVRRKTRSERRIISQIEKLHGIPLRTLCSLLLPIDNGLLIIKNASV